MAFATESHPRVTAVVPVRNRRAISLRFLEQIGRQTYPNLRVVVVDSNSSDGTVEAIREAFPRVQLLVAGDDDYWTGATNRGVRQALASGSEWLLTINDDALIADDHVERLVAIALRHGCPILGSQINVLDDPERIWCLGTFTEWGSDNLLRLGHHGLRNSERGPELMGHEVLPVDALAGNGVLIHHSVFRRIGLYNAVWLPHYHADSELVMRAVSRGISAWVTPQLILLNDFKAEQKSLPLRNVRGMLWSLWHPKSYLYAPALIYLIMANCPNRSKPRTLVALMRRFLGMRH
jgi:GT2 family glycosyltransferase